MRSCQITSLIFCAASNGNHPATVFTRREVHLQRGMNRPIFDSIKQTLTIVIDGTVARGAKRSFS